MPTTKIRCAAPQPLVWVGDSTIYSTTCWWVCCDRISIWCRLNLSMRHSRVLCYAPVIYSIFHNIYCLCPSFSMRMAKGGLLACSLYKLPLVTYSMVNYINSKKKNSAKVNPPYTFIHVPHTPPRLKFWVLTLGKYWNNNTQKGFGPSPLLVVGWNHFRLNQPVFVSPPVRHQKQNYNSP